MRRRHCARRGRNSMRLAGSWIARWLPHAPTSRRNRMAKEVTGKRAIGRTVTGRMAMGRRMMGRKATGRRTTGRRVTGRRVNGRRAMGRKVKGKRAMGRRVTDKKVTGRRATGREDRDRSRRGVRKAVHRIRLRGRVRVPVVDGLAVRRPPVIRVESEAELTPARRQLRDLPNWRRQPGREVAGTMPALAEAEDWMVGRSLICMRLSRVTVSLIGPTGFAMWRKCSMR